MRFEDFSLLDLRDLAESTATVVASAEAGVFEGLHAGPATPEELSRRLGLDARAVAITLPVLEQIGLVQRADEQDRFHLSPRGERELGNPESPEYQAAGFSLWMENLRAWTRLSEALRSGRPVDRAGAGPSDESEADRTARRTHISSFMSGMAAAPAERVNRLTDAVLERRPNSRTMLDLGGGPGHISRAFAARGLEATLLDREEVMEVVRDEFAPDRVEGIETVGADFLTDPLPRGPFDIILLSNILHMLSAEENVALLRKVRDVTAPGGLVAIADFLRGRSPRAARFALLMLLRTDGGNTYTLEEHQAWLREAGFGAAEVTDLDPERQLITAPLADTRPADRRSPRARP